MKFRKSDLIQFMVFLINPFLSLIPIGIGIYNQRKISYILIILFFGLVGFLTTPLHDLYRHHEDFKAISIMSISEFLQEISGRIDILLPLFDFLISKVNATPQFISFTVLIVIYTIIYTVFKKFILLPKKDGFSKQIIFLLFLILFLSVDTFVASTGVRFITSAYIFVYVAISDVYEDKKRYFILLLSVLVHFSFIIMIPLLFIWRRISEKNVIRIFYASFVFAIFGKLIVISIFNVLLNHYTNSVFLGKLNVYINGYWGVGYLELRTIGNLILTNIRYIPYYTIVLYFVLKPFNSGKRNLILLMISVTNVFYDFPNLFGRYSSAVIFFGLFVFAYEYGESKWKFWKLFLQVHVYTLSLIFMLNIYAARRNIKVGYMRQITYKPALLLLTCTYSDDWVELNVGKDGYIINPCCMDPNKVVKKK